MTDLVLIITLIISQFFVVRGSSNSQPFADYFADLEPKDGVFQNDHENPAERIANGQTVTSVTSFPYAALITSTFSDGTVKNCGGALVSVTEVLTTSSCLRTQLGDATSVTVALGAYDRNNVNEAGRITFTLGPAAFGFHNSFNPVTNFANYAVLTLPSPVTTSTRIKTIDIADPTASFVGQTVTVVGWGSTGTGSPRFPQSLTARVISNEDCAQFFAGVRYSHICVISRGVICDGDEGSPLAFTDGNNRRFLLGIASVVPRRLCGIGNISVFGSFSTEEEP